MDRLKQLIVSANGNGQVATLIFASPDVLRNAASELGLALSDDPDQARKGGKAFEEKMIQQLRSEQESELSR